MASTVTCENCGASGNSTDRFCGSCGAPRSVPVPPRIDPPVAAPVVSEPSLSVGIAPDSPPPLDAKSFVRSLYDFGFTSLIATRVIKFVYAALVILYSVVSVFLLLAALATGKPADIVFGIIFVPVFYFLYVIWLRILMELIVVFFKLGEDVHSIRYGAGSSTAGSPIPPRGL